MSLALRLRKKLFCETGVPDAVLLNDSDDRLHAFYRDAYRHDEMVHFIAYGEDGDPVAIAGALLKRDFPYLLFKPGSYGWIIDVYTEPTHRGRGLATRLLSLTHDWLRERGMQEVKLISASKGARRLYQRLGYRSTSEMSLNLSDRPTYNEMIDEHEKKEDARSWRIEEKTGS